MMSKAGATMGYDYPGAMHDRTLRIGLISDTHMPARWEALPASLLDIFAGVDLILHAGDIGELWVLDELSHIAPVVAVHGNDETAEATEALPYCQTLGLLGRRLVLTHSHHQDPQREAAIRANQEWSAKYDYWASLGREHGAEIVVFGHTHIPMAVEHGGIWLINPGAIASASWFTRQTLQTVAVLALSSPGRVSVSHFDVKSSSRGPIDLPAQHDSFSQALQSVSESIFEPDLQGSIRWVRETLHPLAPAHIEGVLFSLCRECWAGERGTIGAADVARTFTELAETPPTVIDALRSSPVFAPYLSDG